MGKNCASRDFERAKGHVPQEEFLERNEDPWTFQEARRSQTNEERRRSLQNARSTEYTELYQTAWRLILDSVGTGTNARGRTCFSLSEAITQTYLLLITTSATTTAFWFWRLPQLYVTTRALRHFSSYEFPRPFHSPLLLPVSFVFFSFLSFTFLYPPPSTSISCIPRHSDINFTFVATKSSSWW